MFNLTVCWISIIKNYFFYFKSFGFFSIETKAKASCALWDHFIDFPSIRKKIHSCTSRWIDYSMLNCSDMWTVGGITRRWQVATATAILAFKTINAFWSTLPWLKWGEQKVMNTVLEFDITGKIILVALDG